MRINLLVMCKLLFLLLIINGFWGYISDPFLPFIKAMDVFRIFPGVFEGVLKTLFFTAGIGLLLNFRVRIMAIILGLCIIIFLLASKPIFRNHLFICGCVFLLCGLTDKDQDPWLLYWQLSLVYVGAVINKVFQLDWWTGEFMHNWLLYARENEFYKLSYDIFPGHLMAKFLSWFSMGIELSVAIMLLQKRWHQAAVWTIVIFHTMLFTLTGWRFGHFFEDILIYLLVFNHWPENQIEITLKHSITPRFHLLIEKINWNRQFLFNSGLSRPNKWLEVCPSDNKVLYNYRALGYIILHTPAMYFSLLIFDTLIRFGFNPIGEHLITAIWLWTGILFFAWITIGRTKINPM